MNIIVSIATLGVLAVMAFDVFGTEPEEEVQPEEVVSETVEVQSASEAVETSDEDETEKET